MKIAEHLSLTAVVALSVLSNDSCCVVATELSSPPLTCFDKGEILGTQDTMYGYLRLAFSKFYENWPFLMIQALPLEGGAFKQATPEDMVEGKEAVRQTVECCRKHQIGFTARSGGHNNAGASVMNGHLTIDLRGLNRIEPIFNEAARNDTLVPFESPGTVRVGAGATAGQAQYVTFNDTSSTATVVEGIFIAGALPVGQKPSVGMSGLTLGGGFGFQTRYAGLLCDRLVSFEAVVPATNETIQVTKDGEHADLFWAACGGGGGNFVVVTDFTYSMMPVCPYVPDDIVSGLKCQGVVEVQYFVPLDVDVIDFYQTWSLRMDPLITPNFEVVNSTHGKVAGIYMGPLHSFFLALNTSGITESTPLTYQGFTESSIHVPDFAQAITDLSGWTDNQTASVLVDNFLNERSFFKYKSFFLLEQLPREAIEILIQFNNVSDDSNSLVFEFQALGGGPTNPNWTTTNAFSSVHPKDTAFAHRNARHCLMLKATGETIVQGQYFFQEMETAYTMLAPLVLGQSVYYNHMDLSLPPGDDPYFRNGVETDDRVGINETDFWVNKLAAVRRKYNPNNLLSNLRPCCGDAFVNTCDMKGPPAADGPSSSGAKTYSIKIVGLAAMAHLLGFAMM